MSMVMKCAIGVEMTLLMNILVRVKSEFGVVVGPVYVMRFHPTVSRTRCFPFCGGDGLRLCGHM